MTSFESSDFFRSDYSNIGFPISPDENNLEIVREFLLAKWRERAAERSENAQIPDDLSSSCKFSALFGSIVFGADITGNYDHLFNVIDDEIVDINQFAKDVVALRRPYKIDEKFLAFNDDLYESLKSCVPRVEAWISEFGQVYELKKSNENLSPA